MSLRWPVIAEAWCYGDPLGIADGLMRRSARLAERGEKISLRLAPAVVRDRYYTQARRLHVKQLMRGKR